MNTLPIDINALNLYLEDIACSLDDAINLNKLEDRQKAATFARRQVLKLKKMATDSLANQSVIDFDGLGELTP